MFIIPQPIINLPPTNPSSKTMFKRLYTKIPLAYHSLNSHSFYKNFNTRLGNPIKTLNSDNFLVKTLDSDTFSSLKSYPDRNLHEIGPLFDKCDRFGVKRFASVAEAIVSSSPDSDVSFSDSVSVSTNGDEGDEVEKLLSEMGKQEQRQATRGWWRLKREKTGSSWNYVKLKRRQVKVETEAWELAAKEYKELLNDMCEQKLAPNLPYMKSLFLGWFEPLCKRIEDDHEMCRKKKHKAAYAPFFDLLPADKMAVITMHKIMGLIMTGGENGCARVVSASCSVGEAIEQEVTTFV